VSGVQALLARAGEACTPAISRYAQTEFRNCSITSCFSCLRGVFMWLS